MTKKFEKLITVNQFEKEPKILNLWRKNISRVNKTAICCPGLRLEKIHFFEEKEIFVFFWSLVEKTFVRFSKISFYRPEELFEHQINVVKTTETFLTMFPIWARSYRNFGKINFCSGAGVVKRFFECPEEQWKPTISFFNWRTKLFSICFGNWPKNLGHFAKKTHEPKKEKTCTNKKSRIILFLETFFGNGLFVKWKTLCTLFLTPGNHSLDFWWQKSLARLLFLSSIWGKCPKDQLDEKLVSQRGDNFLSIGFLAKNFELLTKGKPQDFQNRILLSRATYWETRIFVKKKNTFANFEFC